MEASEIKSNQQIEKIILTPPSMYKASEKNIVSYQLQMVRDNQLYTITCSALGSTKELALQRFNNNRDLLSEIAQSFSFERKQYYSPEHNLSIAIPDGWSKYPSQKGAFAIYGKPESGQNFVIRAIPFNEKVEDLTWQELFYPQYDSFYIEKKDLIEVNGKYVKYCVYEITDQRLKVGQNIKQMLAVFTNNSKLYLITFTDNSDGFKNNYPVFIDAINSIKFQSKNQRTARQNI